MSSTNFQVFLGTYNAEPWIKSVIYSLESQDHEPFTVKIIDNASEDNTVQIIEKLFSEYTFRNTYELIKSDKNVGAISSFYERLNLFEAEWIVMIHQDDIYHSDHISTLVDAINTADSEVGIVFSAMKRVDAENNEKLSPPTLASKLLEKDRFGNFLLSLQIFPINFPACAMRKSQLLKSETTRHTTAFNDTELLLRMLCFSDIIYTQKETMHYRVFDGNAASQTSKFANDRAVFIGLNEIFHSTEFKVILELAKTDLQIKNLIHSINQAIDIRINDEFTKKLAKNAVAEILTRHFGYTNELILENLHSSLSNFNLVVESGLAKNQRFISDYSITALNLSTESSFVEDFQSIAVIKTARFVKFSSVFSLELREKCFNLMFNSKIFVFVRRPFIKVWRRGNKSATK